MLLRPSLLLSLSLLAACANPPAEPVTVSGTVVEARGKFYLQSEQGNYHLNWMPQLHYKKYLGRELVVQGNIPAQCAQAWQDSIVKVQGGAELVDWNKVDWSECIAAERVSLVTPDGEQLIYDWHKINMRDYYF